ncbi:MAG TPA: hypothetical protein VM165_16825, partial [Planctomycetaceae bacterium]|nr:hypothetical protein [Planctomycetaceae bacterium]
MAFVLALSTTAQTYLSMMGHGHSFVRMFVWQLSIWAFWAAVAPLVIRRGTRPLARDTSRVRDILGVIVLGVGLFGVNSVISAEMTLWIQPFLPAVTYSFTRAWINHFPAGLVVTLLAYGLLLALGAALWTR